MINKKLSWLFIAVVVVVFALLLFLRGNEDTWICQDGAWVQHGHPSASKPTEPCGDEPVACAMDAKLCADGSFVSRIAPECNFELCPKEDLIQLETPRANDIISSPLIINGRARGYWYFEADFPIKLYNSNGELLGTAVAQANPPEGGDWMTEDFVPFSAKLDFTNPGTANGTLVLEKDNPSDLPENDDQLRVPVVFSQDTLEIQLYYYNPDLDKDESGNVQCTENGLVPVGREIEGGPTLIKDTIELLIAGELTEDEEGQGITTEFPLSRFSLLSVDLDGGVLTLTFDDPEFKSSGGACRAGILKSQVEATAKQFSAVEEVKFLPDEIFQP